MDIFRILKKDANNLLYKVNISDLIDDTELNKIDGRRLLPSILRKSNLSQGDKMIIIKRKKKINQQNALKAFRQRARDDTERMQNELKSKQQQKHELQKEKQTLMNDIRELETKLEQ